jgi:hydrogenase expression/formation protein HypC
VCLAVPGRILSTEERDASRHARVEFGGIVREVRLDLVPEARVGDYVMVHVGIAISRVDTDEAEETLSLLREMGALEEGARPAADAGASADG